MPMCNMNGEVNLDEGAEQEICEVTGTHLKEKSVQVQGAQEQRCLCLRREKAYAENQMSLAV